MVVLRAEGVFLHRLYWMEAFQRKRGGTCAFISGVFIAFEDRKGESPEYKGVCHDGKLSPLVACRRIFWKKDWVLVSGCCKYHLFYFLGVI